MKIYFISIITFFSLCFIVSCNHEDKKEKDNNLITDTSIFNIHSTWKTQHNEEVVLSDLRGKVLVMVMIYTTCKAACPRLVADMRSIEKQIPEKQLNNIQFVLVSIDPENDTPDRLLKFAINNKMDKAHWLFLQGNKSSTQEFANVLAVKYKKISPVDFSHSNIISVFDPNGDLVFQQEGLGVNNKNTIDAIVRTLNTN